MLNDLLSSSYKIQIDPNYNNKPRRMKSRPFRKTSISYLREKVFICNKLNCLVYKLRHTPSDAVYSGIC